LYGSTWNNMRDDLVGFSFDDRETETAMIEIDQKFGYTIDPHGAVGYLALQAYQAASETEAVGVILETAHPAKFLEDVERILNRSIEIPDRLKELEDLEKVATPLEPDFVLFKEWLFRHAQP
ncbi:MAG: threonine synthase, partial [Saprospiraceae bacterium]